MTDAIRRTRLRRGRDDVPTLTTASDEVSAPFTVNVAFTEPVNGLTESDFTVTNGTVTASSLSGSGATWSVEIAPVANGEVLVTLPAFYYAGYLRFLTKHRLAKSK